MLRFLLRSAVYVLSLILVAGGVGAFGYLSSQKQFWLSVRNEPIPSLQGVEKPVHDPNKPTVAVLLGNENTEGLDFTIPYQIFSMTGAYNVYAVAADNQVKSLTGGLDVVPHYSFAELDAVLGKSPDIITIPYMTMFDAKSFQPVREWILKHKETTLVSICAGADNLAATGLLDGKLGATHWQTMPVLTRKYPEVNWTQDQRYVVNDGGKMVSSAGISSGIDAVLHVISEQLGEPMAEKIAKELNYPSYPFVKNPKVEPFQLDFRYSTYMLNNAFHWNKTEAGVLLYNGVEEMAVASVFDIYSDSGTTRVHSISSTDQPIVTKHGLTLLPRYTMSNLPKLDKMIVPGTQAKTLAASEIKTWGEKGNGKELQFVHSDPNRFLFELQLEDLAKQEDILTAAHAVKRLEFRANDFQLEGKPFPLETYGELLLTLAGSLLIAFFIDRRFISKRKGTARSCPLHR
ncbi:DJ-1/PfpI family protein [Brevibacillus massiliensis]|uniref:DJ-1/PfpI family protein n=1 Tax=Brevibacillus massiliensis TaxID=1118054 RepID=UPI00031D0074|nr:DJ-1/PfpI family protein [Brevibacillus massiliensis]